MAASGMARHNLQACSAAVPALLLALLAATPALAGRIGPASTSTSAEQLEQRRTWSSRTRAAQADAVHSLPGWGEVNNFDLFAGYITVDEAAGRALFYIFAESSGSPEEDPLVLWLNGGPGCSSIGGGFMSELGPWLPLPGGRRLVANPGAWNRAANVLFIESPAFVGFSYSNTSSDAVVGDERTSTDLRKFLIGFYQRFPEHRDAEFYISGESYAGHYVPNLAWTIVQGNRAAAPGSEDELPLSGILVGNPWTDAAIDNAGAVDFWWSHALIGDSTARGIKENCNFSVIGPLDWHPEHDNPWTKQELCDEYCNRGFNELGPINIYEIYADTCVPPGLASHAGALSRQLSAHAAAAENSQQASATGGKDRRAGAASFIHPAALASGAAHRHHELQKLRGGSGRTTLRLQRVQRLLQAGARVGPSTLAAAGGASNSDGARSGGLLGDAPPGYDPCVDDEVAIYLNTPIVQAALHANQTVRLPGYWEDCSRKVVYSRDDLLSSVLPTYRSLIDADVRILIYSGDVDGIVPVVGTRRWTAGLGLKETKRWRAWEDSDGQVGGWWVQYQGLWFATVRNAGHMVPYVQPLRALNLFEAFLAEQPLS